MSELELLKEQNRLLLECVNFYANLSNWRLVTIHGLPTMINSEDMELTDPYEDYYCRQGGKRARETQKKLNYLTTGVSQN